MLLKYLTKDPYNINFPFQFGLFIHQLNMFKVGNFSDIEHRRDAYYGQEAGNYSLFDILRAITIMFMSPIACIRKECHDQ